MEIDLVRILMTIINFLILVLVLKHFFWSKIGAVIQERQNNITEKMNVANEYVKETERLKIENENILSMAKQEGKKITKERKKRADKIYDEIIEYANVEAQTIKENAKNDIDRELQKAKFEIKEQVIDLSIAVSKKALEKNIDDDEQRRLIQNFIDEVI